MAEAASGSSPRTAASSEKCGSIALSLVWQFALGWVSMMVGSAILTPHYGGFVEKRMLV